MTDIRVQNNLIKRDFLNTWVKKGSKVLDVGCGQGGDLHKWKHIGVKLTGVDPNPWAIEEARRRSKNQYGTFIVGDIRSAPLEQYDVICYNFSLQYQPLELFQEIVKRLKKGGLFLGIVTDSTRLFEGGDSQIHIERVDEDHIRVFIPDTPYYAHGPIVEPLVDKDKLIHTANEHNMELVYWDSFSIYSKFVFKYK